MTLPQVEPMELEQYKLPFSDPEWFFEIKYDGFRALAYIESGECTVVSRNEHVYTRYSLRTALPFELEADNAILDGELVCVDDDGHARFYDLMLNRAEPIYAAFDLLWLDGEDLRGRPLWERKSLLEGAIRQPPSRLMYVQHIEEHGTALFDQMCALDMEGIVCKPKISPYRTVRGKTTWIKVKNQDYSQAEGRRDLFNSRR